MLRLGCARLVFKPLKVPAPPLTTYARRWSWRKYRHTRTRKGFNVLQGMLGLGPEGWVPTTDRYEKAVALSKQMKKEGLADAISESEKVEIMEHWPWDDMDEFEEAYM